MSDSLTLTDCDGLYDAGAQVVLATITLRFVVAGSYSLSGDTYTADFDETITLTRVDYDASADPGPLEYCIVRRSCSPYPRIVPQSWQQSFAASLHTTSTGSVPCDRLADVDLLFDLTAGWDLSPLNVGANWAMSAVVTSGSGTYCNNTFDLFGNVDSINLSAFSYDHFSLAEMADNQVGIATAAHSTGTATVN